MNKIIFDIGANQNVDIIEAKKFNVFSNIMASLYQRFFTGNIRGLFKIAIDLYQHKIPMKICNYKENGGVCVIFRSFDFNNFIRKDKNSKQKEILEILQNSVIKMCEKFKIDKIPFVNAYEKVIENNYKNQYIFNRLTFSRNRKYKAGIEINMTKNGTKINILFTDKNENILKRNEIFKTFSHYYFVHQIIYSGKWLDNQKYIASSRNKNINFIASINSPKTELKIKPKEKEKEILEKLNRMKI